MKMIEKPLYYYNNTYNKKKALIIPIGERNILWRQLGRSALHSIFGDFCEMKRGLYGDEKNVGKWMVSTSEKVAI